MAHLKRLNKIINVWESEVISINYKKKLKNVMREFMTNRKLSDKLCSKENEMKLGQMIIHLNLISRSERFNKI